MAEVETYVTFDIATTLNVYWFPILVPIGLVGNTLSLLVMIKPNNRKISTCIYMAVLSVNDNLMMCLALSDWLISVIHICHAMRERRLCLWTASQSSLQTRP